MEFYTELEKFLSQAGTENLKSKHFRSEYLGTKVQVSFGKGNQAKIPWISFLIKPNTTSGGIYPVFLYYKETNTLVLAYGISETKKPETEWKLDSPVTIREYYLNKFGKKPERYGSSYIFKTYNLAEELNPEILNEDLRSIINKYKSVLNKSTANTITTKNKNKFDITHFQEACKNAKLIYQEGLITRFTASILTKPFVILTGLSGSGKTRLAQSFAQWICTSDQQYQIIPVGADWTNREPLLGYVNALRSSEYILPENGALKLILRANEHQEEPHFLILDEMNLSLVERYFADFLSIMESNDNFKLHSDKENLKSTVPHEIGWPKNLFVVGTVNIDETTYMFSPKVLDRANVIEFRVDERSITEFLTADKEAIPLTKKGETMGNSFVSLVKSGKTPSDFTELNTELLAFFTELQSLGAEFGYRTASEIQTLFTKIDLVNPDYSNKPAEKIDIAIMQKLLPKIHGSRRKLLPTLTKLAQNCLNEKQEIIFDDRGHYNIEITNNIKYKLSFEKIARMYKSAIENGFASYAEA